MEATAAAGNTKLGRSPTMNSNGEDCGSSKSKKRRRVSSGDRRRAGAVSMKASSIGHQNRHPKLLCGVSTSLPQFLLQLDGGPYVLVASWLHEGDLCRMDAVCPLLRTLNSLPAGPWRQLGEKAFFGMELDVERGFVPFQQKHAHWKTRCKFFHSRVATFSAPFSGREIAIVDQCDQIAYCRCRLRLDVLSTAAIVARTSSGIDVAASSTFWGATDCGVYVEVEVISNADNLSLAVIDYDSGGRSSITFSPEMGAVLRETKVRDWPVKIEGTYINLLPVAAPGRRFEGVMGLYLSNAGHLAFFRKWAATNSSSVGDEAATRSLSTVDSSRAAAALPAGVAATVPWETTGFCTDLRRAQGPRFSLCISFRDPGAYRVRISRVCRSPPFWPSTSAEAYQEDRWRPLYMDDDHSRAI